MSTSGACQTCKLRKIKCDEGKPICQRCTKGQRICIPISTMRQSSLSVHIENRFASGKIKRPRGPRSSFARPAPVPDLQTRALAYYLQYHLHITTDRTNFAGGWSECISEWKNSGRSSPMVDLALSALALAVYSHTQHDPVAVTEASSKYADLLQVVQERIVRACPSVDKSDIDSYLLTIFLMSRYEGSIHRPGSIIPQTPFESLQTWSHHDGALAILKLWYHNRSQDGTSSIIRQTRRGSIKSHLLRNLELPDWVLDGHVFGEQGLSLEYDRILVRIVNMHHATNQIQQYDQPSIPQIEKLDREGHELDSAMQEWTSHFPAGCTYLRQSLPGSGPWPSNHFYSSTIYCYSNANDAALWSQYFATTMLLLNTLWRVLQKLRPGLVWKEHLLERNPLLKDMADGLASSIPFCLERVKAADPKVSSPSQRNPKIIKGAIKPYLAGLVVWPLTIASSLDGIDEKQRQWFRSELAELGRVTGDGGLECAETEQWVKL